MSRIGAHLDAIEGWLKALSHEGQPIVHECRRQLDLVDAEDIERQSFRSPAGFLVLPRFRLVNRTDGGKDAELWIVIGVAVKARPGASADIDVIDRAVTIAAALDDTTFGQVQCGAVTDIDARPVLQAAIESKGLAIAAVSFRQMLFRVTPSLTQVQEPDGIVGAGPLPPRETPTVYTADELSLDELAVIEQWGQP